MMIVHHEGAIASASLVADRATHDELRVLATDIITAQTAEIDRFNRWLREWYGLTPRQYILDLRGALRLAFAMLAAAVAGG